MQHDPPQNSSHTPPADAAEREPLAALRALAGATLQKIYLLSPRAAELQLRLPGRTLVAAVDAALGAVAIWMDRRAGAEREAAPRAQATLRAALAGASLRGARLELPATAPPGARRPPALRLSFATPRGPRALVADPRAGALVLLATDGDPAVGAPEPGGRVVWLGGPGGELRTGAAWPAAREVAAAAAAPVAPEGAAAPGASPSSADRPAAPPPAADASLRVRAAMEEAALAARRRELVKRLRARADKLERTLRAVQTDLERAREARALRERAQLLLPEQGRVPRGARSAQVPDWSRLDDEGKPALADLPLDPALSAAENAARWLKRAQRYGAAVPRIEARRAQVAGELAEARERLARAQAAADAAALRELELGERPAARPRGRAREQARTRLPFRLFRSADGGRILVGRSARDNDALTFGAARGNDLWLHARGVQGSHVVVPDPGPAPDPALIREAALLAAHFSSARGADAVEVSWTRRKHVRKPKGAPPGSVLYSQEKTLRVRASDEALAKALAREEPGA